MITIFKNGRIFLNDKTSQVESTDLCLIVNGDVIDFVGSSSHAKVQEAEQGGAKVHDLKGMTLAPGFIDGHMHLLMFGNSIRKIDLTPCRSLDDIRRTIKEAAQQDSTSSRVLCKGYMHSMTDGKALASDIDDLDPRPIFIDAKDLHSTWCNRAALKEMKISRETPDPQGGEIFRDMEGNPSGLMSEGAAVSIVWPHLATVQTMEDRLEAIRTAHLSYVQAGYTGMIEMAMDEIAFEALEVCRSQRNLDIRLAMHWLIRPLATTAENIAQVDRAIELHQQYNLESSPDFRIAGIKIIGDGIVDACTAALVKPYSSNGVSCNPLWSAEMLEEVVRHADAAGLQCAIHAIGDATVKLAIDTLEKVNPKGKRHRIEHLELTSPGDAQRLHELEITASVQAVHADPAIVKAWPKLLGEARCKRAFAYGEFHEHGVHISLGTDAPTAPSAALPNLYTATTRRSAREPELTDTFNADFALPFLTAIQAATTGSAYSCFADRITGTLAEGMKADLVILDMEWSPENLLQANVRETWFNGRPVYQSVDLKY